MKTSGPVARDPAGYGHVEVARIADDHRVEFLVRSLDESCLRDREPRRRPDARFQTCARRLPRRRHAAPRPPRRRVSGRRSPAHFLDSRARTSRSRGREGASTGLPVYRSASAEAAGSARGVATDDGPGMRPSHRPAGSRPSDVGARHQSAEVAGRPVIDVPGRVAECRTSRPARRWSARQSGSRGTLKRSVRRATRDISASASRGLSRCSSTSIAHAQSNESSSKGSS